MTNEKKVALQRSENRKRNHHGYLVRVDKEEFETLELNAKITGLTANELMRQLGLGYQPKSLIDVSFTREILRLRGDLGRVGGLLKQHIHQTENKHNFPAIKLIEKIKGLQNEIRDLVDRFKLES